mmetsp:Transcript_25596/g.70656  ORF Transcript_25596/g.70656 Transcript_25596/m.70656 type:complete len:241 (+) Transcript_25596:84-806(+)
MAFRLTLPKLSQSSSRAFNGLKPFKTDLNAIESNPLLELQKSCIQRGIADVEGYRLNGAPWAFTLGEVDATTSRPSVRTIGFQRVSEAGLDWLTRRKSSLVDEAVAICYTAGVYPPPAGESCEQWRAEGQLAEIPIVEALKTAPRGSLAQILAVGRISEGRDERLAMYDRERFLMESAKAKEQLQSADVEIRELEASVRFVRLMPDRMELLVSGNIWERFEWTRNHDNASWSAKQQLLPY